MIFPHKESVPVQKVAVATLGHDIVVIGTSAGGLNALAALVDPLPAGLPASLFIVQHLSPEATTDALIARLSKQTPLICKQAEPGERFRHGHVYVAPPDAHLLIKTRRLLVTKGARENRYRPSIDTLFRSAAVAYGPRVIGVILTGFLDDGTVGLQAIKQCGGLTVVQDPKDAAYPDMPQHALNAVAADHCVPIDAMAHLLETLIRAPAAASKPIHEDIRTEAEIAERVVSDIAQVNRLGHQVPYNCPNCGGGLWEMERSDVPRYRCHTGHAFTAAALLASQNETIEETLWTSLRMFEERKNLLHSMGQKETRGRIKRDYLQRAKETEVHIQRIRAMLLTPQAGRSWKGAGVAKSEKTQPRAGRRLRSR